MKIISKLKAPQAYLDKFLPREIQALKRLRHSSIVSFPPPPHSPCVQVQLFEVVDMADKVCLVMELATGGDLLEYINRRGHLVEPHAAMLFGQLAAAVQYCHGERIIHR